MVLRRSNPVDEMDSWRLDGKHNKNEVKASCYEGDVGAESWNMLGGFNITVIA